MATDLETRIYIQQFSNIYKVTSFQPVFEPHVVIDMGVRAGALAVMKVRVYMYSGFCFVHFYGRFA